jgi:hypothetical protein
MTRFPQPPRQTGRADLPHPAFALVSQSALRQTRSSCSGERAITMSWLTVELLLRDPVSNGVSGQRPMLLASPSSEAHQMPGLLPSTGVTRLRQYYGPSDSHAGPLPGGTVEGRDPSPTWVSRVATLSFSTCCPQYPGESLGNRTVAFFRAWQPSPRQRWVGTRGITFEACSRFTRVTARGFAGPPKEDFCPSGLTNPVTQDQPARSYRGDSVNSSGRTFTCKSAPPLHGARCLTYQA